MPTSRLATPARSWICIRNRLRIPTPTIMQMSPLTLAGLFKREISTPIGLSNRKKSAESECQGFFIQPSAVREAELRLGQAKPLTPDSFLGHSIRHSTLDSHLQDHGRQPSGPCTRTDISASNIAAHLAPATSRTPTTSHLFLPPYFPYRYPYQQRRNRFTEYVFQSHLSAVRGERFHRDQHKTSLFTLSIPSAI